MNSVGLSEVRIKNFVASAMDKILFISKYY
jgi:hypothetical protein